MFGGRRRRRYGRNVLFGSFYMSLGAQYTTTIVAAIAFAGLVFTGLLLFRATDKDDLLARGQKYMAEGKVAWAAQTFQTLVTKYPDHYRARVELGKAYLALDDRRRAEEQFKKASALPNHDNGSYAAEVAQSKLLLAQERYKEAETYLRKAYIKSKPSKRSVGNGELRLALFELYETWGDVLMKEQKPLSDVVNVYEKSLAYVDDFEQEERLKDKVLGLMGELVGDLVKAEKPDEALKVLKRMLRHRYTADSLVRVAEFYERTNDPDNAIIWYRKAFEKDPDAVALKLSNMLTQKARGLEEAKKPEKAQGFYQEAEAVLQAAALPPEQLYPVEVASLKVIPKLSGGMLNPEIKVAFQNQSRQNLNYLATKVILVADGGEILSEVKDTVATAKEPMGAKGSKTDEVAKTLKLKEPVNIKALAGKSIKVKVAIAYTEDKKPHWEMKAVQEIKIQGRGSATTEASRPPEPSEQSQPSDQVPLPPAPSDAG